MGIKDRVKQLVLEKADLQKKQRTVIVTEQVTQACGHIGEVPIYQGESADHSTARKTKWMKRKCAVCNEADLERVKREAEKRRAANAATNIEKQRTGFPSRLPDGAEFHVRYSSETTSWTGRLLIPGVHEFNGNKSSVFMLLRYLDKMYRQSQRGE